MKKLLTALAALALILPAACKRHHPHTDVIEEITVQAPDIIVVEENNTTLVVLATPGATTDLCGDHFISDAAALLGEDILDALPELEGLSTLLVDGDTYYLLAAEAGTYDVGDLGSVTLVDDGLLLITSLELSLGAEGVELPIEDCARMKLVPPMLKIGRVKVRLR
jgi:hypothetical protein